MTTVLSPLLLVVLVLTPPLTKVQGYFIPCNATQCNETKPLCLEDVNRRECYCPENSWGDNCENTCGGNVTDCEGVITSLNYPSMYPNLLLCTWRFQAPDGFQVTLNFNDFQLAGDFFGGCLLDVVSINGIEYCNFIVPPPPTSAQSIELTLFSSNDLKPPIRGFNVSYTVGDPNQCDPDPCQNGATCLDGCFSFTCVCPPGFTGTLCEATTYTLKYCIRRKVSKRGKLVPPAVNVTLTGSAGSTGTVTLTLRPLCGVCDSVTLTLTYIGDIQAATVTPTYTSCNQLNPLYFQLAVSSGVGQWCSFPSTVWYRDAKTKTLAASCSDVLGSLGGRFHPRPSHTEDFKDGGLAAFLPRHLG